MDIEKEFDYLDRDFLICFLRKFCFGDFIKFHKMDKNVVKYSRNMCFNWGTTTQYFNLEKCALQGHLISDICIKSRFDDSLFITAYANDSKFFLGDCDSVKNLANIFQTFSQFSGLKPSISKCEIAGIGLLNGAIETVCWLKLVDLTLDTIKILMCTFFYNKEAKHEKNFLSQLEICKSFFVCGTEEIFQ